MCDCEYENAPEFFEDRVVKKSRKTHKCEECRKEIPVGHSYYQAKGVWEGDFLTFERCMRCRRICEAILAREDGCAVAFGGMRERLYEFNIENKYHRQLKRRAA